mgnify:CR=1 FL=1
MPVSDPESDTAVAALRARNLQFLAGLDPALAARLRAIVSPLTRPVIADGTVIDIDLGEGRLYNCPADAFAAEQVAAFLAQPTRLLVNAPAAEKLMDPCSAELVRRFEAAAASADAPPLAAPPPGRSGILFVVGLGLGRHLDALIAATAPRHVVLVEPLTEFLLHAMAATDWRALHATCGSLGAALHFVAEGDPAACVARLETVMSGIGETAIDGSHIYVHYAAPATREIADRIHQFAGMRTILKGYFADERLMVENTTANVTARDFRLLDGGARPALDVPAIVVGSGPSLDASIDAIRRCRDHAVVISAGSALQALLHHGIVPDWHVEKENSTVSAERLRHIMARNRDRFPTGRFAGVRLIASSTVDPGVVDLFDDITFFLRTSLSSTAMFGAGHAALDGTSPFSANAALTIVAILGFRDVFLFGCDCGARSGAGHHSRNTVYYTRAESRDGGRDAGAGRVEFPQTAPANFGGTVDTNAYFLWSRRTYEQVIAALSLRAHNCSDGIAIAGATALAPDDLAPEAGGAPLDRTALAAYLDGATRWYPAGGYLDGQDVAGAVAGWRSFAAALRTTLDRLDGEAGDIHAFHRGLAVFLDAAEKRWGGPVVLAGGTLRAQPVLASWWLNRAPDASRAAALFADFRTACRATAEGVLAEGDALMARVAERGAPLDLSAPDTAASVLAAAVPMQRT